MNEIEEIIGKIKKEELYLPEKWKSAWMPKKEDVIEYIKEGRYKSAAFCLKYLSNRKLESEYKKLIQLAKYTRTEKIPENVQRIIDTYIAKEKEKMKEIEKRAEARRMAKIKARIKDTISK